MRLLRTLLLASLGTAILTGTSIKVSAASGSSDVKEPPSTTLVVQGETSLSETTEVLTAPKPVTALAVIPPPKAITDRYVFNEVSKRVKALQKQLGTVAVDGHYGPQTRRAHVAALKKAGLSTSIVPAPSARYNISYNSEHRCPQFEDEFRKLGLEPVDVFSYIAWRESRCNPKAVNAKWKDGKVVWTLNKDGSYDSGLLQINSSWRSVTAAVCRAPQGDLSVLLGVDCNLKVAKYIMDESSGKLANWKVRKIG